MSQTITFLDEVSGEVVVPVAPEQTLLEAAVAAKVPLFHDCDGRARCTTCRVRVVDGLEHLSARTSAESEIARTQNWSEDTRLACQVRTAGPLQLKRLVRQEIRQQHGEDHDAWTRSEERQLAVLFCDVNGFTEFAATCMPYDVVHVVNRLFLRIGEAVLANSGYIDKYLGDGLLALWGVDGGKPRDNVLNAIRAALSMKDLVAELSRHLQPQFNTDLSLRIGVHFGTAIVGRIGHPARQQLTAIGDTVNIAARVEVQNKDLRTNLLITEECLAQVRDDVIVGDDFKTVLRSQSRPHRLYEITGLRAPDAIFIVQRQIHQVLLHGHEFVHRFYQELFARSAEIRALFKDTLLPRQYDLFLNQLAWTVRELRHLPEIMGGLVELGERHRTYGVRPEHFPVAGEALLAALAATLGDDFDEPSRAAWTEAFQGLATAMQRETKG